MAPDRYALVGPLTFESVPSLWQQGAQLVAAQSCVTLDLEGVTRTDSAGLALMIEWLRTAKSKNARLHFRNVPMQLHAIAAATGVEHLFAGEGNE